MTARGSALGPAPEVALVLICARNEADRIEQTIAALAEAFPAATLWIADDHSTDATAALGARGGARVTTAPRHLGKGAAAGLALARALATVRPRPQAIVVLCDGDLGRSAAQLPMLAAAVARGELDLAVATFSRRVGGGLGLVVAFARWAIRRRCAGLRLEGPISGQRAIRLDALTDALPFAEGYGMELAMTIDVAQAGHRIGEIELDLTHRATGATAAGFAHRARQGLDLLRAYHGRRP